MARIMVADDSESVRMIMADIISIGGHELVYNAKDGKEAVEQFIAKKPDVLLLDLAMPKKDGLDVIKEIIADMPEAKIIVITASDNQKIIKQCLEEGAKSYIGKPFDFDKVLKEINAIV